MAYSLTLRLKDRIMYLRLKRKIRHKLENGSKKSGGIFKTVKGGAKAIAPKE